MKKKTNAIAALAASMGLSPTPAVRGLRHYGRPAYRRPSMSKCGLPSCMNKTGRDYCCADHCHEHRESVRARRGFFGKTSRFKHA